MRVLHEHKRCFRQIVQGREDGANARRIAMWNQRRERWMSQDQACGGWRRSAALGERNLRVGAQRRLQIA